MQLIEPTVRRCLAIWWAFVWRSFVLWIPFQLVAMVIMLGTFSAMGPPGPDGRMDPAAVDGVLAWFPLIWIVMIAGMVISGTLAIRWMLKKQRWTDFFVALISASDPRSQI